MHAESNVEAQVETCEIRGCKVEIREHGDELELRIDGKRHKCFQTKEGFLLADHVYTSPQPRLLDAVEAYLASSVAEE